MKQKLTYLFAGCAAMRHCVMSADLTKVATVNTIVSETAVNQPRLVEVRMSCVDVRQLYCY